VLIRAVLWRDVGQGRVAGRLTAEDVDRLAPVGAGGRIGADDLAVEQGRLDGQPIPRVQHDVVDVDVRRVLAVRVVGVVAPGRVEGVELAVGADHAAILGPRRMHRDVAGSSALLVPKVNWVMPLLAQAVATDAGR
jgi:hypothetical protein